MDLPEEELTSILENDGTGKHAFNHRFEAIHLRGTEKMNTQDVFDYFKGYAPATIEWINDFSCKNQIKNFICLLVIYNLLNHVWQ